MKTTMRQWICLSICVAMLLVLFAGCGKEPISDPIDVTAQSVVTPLDTEWSEDTTTTVSKEENDESSAPQTPSVSEDSPSSREQILKYPVDESPSSAPAKEEPKPIHIVFQSIYGEQYGAETEMGKLWKDHFGKMERQGVVTSFAALEPETAVEVISKEVFAGRISADVYEVSLAMSHQLAVKKVLCNLTDSKTLNQKAFDNGGTHSNTINGKTYGVSLSANLDVPMMVYNQDLLKRYAPDVDVSALIKQGKWNYQTFRDLAKKCIVDTDGDGRTDIWPIVSDTGFINGSLLANAGGYATMKQGRISSVILDSPFKNTVSFCSSLFKIDRTWKYFGTLEKCADSFKGEKGMMLVASSKRVFEIAKELSFDYGVAPLPVERDVDNGCGVADAQVLVVPKTNTKRLDDVGKWLNGVAKIDQKLMQEHADGLDDHSLLTYQKMLRDATANYFEGVLSSYVTDGVCSGVLNQFHEKIFYAADVQAQKDVDEFYAPLYEE